MRAQSLDQRIEAARKRAKMHTSEVRDLVEHLIEVRDVARMAGLPYEIVAGLPPELYEAIKGMAAWAFDTTPGRAETDDEKRRSAK